MAKTTTNTAVNNTVVQNDTSVVDYKQQTLATLHKMVSEREDWENTAYRKSNEMLYAILQKCYTAHHAMLGNNKEAQDRRSGLNQFIAEQGYRFTDATPLVTKVVKCVFGVDRRRVSAYSIVLREAIKQNILLQDLPNWIEKNGGVEQIRLSKSQGSVTAKQKAEICKNALVNADVLAVVKSDALSKAADGNFEGEDCVLLAMQQADGTYAVRAVVHSKGAVNAALAAYYTTNKTVVTNDTKKAEAANDAKVRDAAIAKASA